MSRNEKKRSTYQLLQILDIGIDIDREIEEVRDVGNAAAVARRAAGLQDIQALDDQDVGLVDDLMLACQHIIGQMRIERCRDIAFSRLDIGHEAQDRRQVIAFRKALAAHQAFALEHRVGHQKTVGGDKIDLGMIGPARQQPLQNARRRALADGDAAAPCR